MVEAVPEPAHGEARVRRVRMSWEEYAALPGAPKSEWVRGTVVVNAPESPGHSDASYGLATMLKRGLPGLRVYGQVGVRLPGERVRVPDVMVLRERPESAYATETPILVVEVLSPGTHTVDLLEKAPEYAEAGVGQFWVVDPEAGSIEIYELVDGRWEALLRLDEHQPTGEVAVGDHGVVPLDLPRILAGDL